MAPRDPAKGYNIGLVLPCFGGGGGGGHSLQGVYLSSRVGSEPLSWQAGSQDEGVTGDRIMIGGASTAS